MDVARFALQGAHIHADVINLLTWELTTFIPPFNNTPLHFISSAWRHAVGKLSEPLFHESTLGESLA